MKNKIIEILKKYSNNIDNNHHLTCCSSDFENIAKEISGYFSDELAKVLIEFKRKEVDDKLRDVVKYHYDAIIEEQENPSTEFMGIFKNLKTDENTNK